MTQKLLWDFDIQMDHVISARRPDFIIINKKKRTSKIVDFAVSADRRKIKRKLKKNKNLDFTKELKKLEHESDVYMNSNWCSQYNHQRIFKGIGGLGNKMTSGDHPNYSIVEIGQNTEKSPED